MRLLAPQLQALVELAAHDGHMTRAAAALDIPQSSMSRRIHALETDLRIGLLLRSGRTVTLTPAAIALAEQIRGPLRELEAVIDAIAGENDPERGTVRFGFPLTMGSGDIPNVLSAFRRAHPGIRVVLKQAHGGELSADLAAGEVDLAIVIPPPARIRHTIVGSQRIVVALPTGHRLAGASTLRIDQLASEPFIANPPSYNLRQLTDSWCRDAGFSPDIAFEVSEFGTIRELIERGLGIALLPPDERRLPGIVEIALVGRRYRREIALASAATRDAPATRLLADFLREHFAAA